MTQKHTHKKETDEIYECESLSQVRHEHITAARTYNYSLCNLCVTFILISKMFTKAAIVFTCEGVRRRVIVGFNPHAARGRVSRARWQLKQRVVSFPLCVFYSGWCSVRWDVHSQQHSTRQEKKSLQTVLVIRIHFVFQTEQTLDLTCAAQICWKHASYDITLSISVYLIFI